MSPGARKKNRWCSFRESAGKPSKAAVLTQAPGCRARHSRRTRAPRVDRRDGLVALLSRFTGAAHADREGHHRAGGLHQPDRRARLRRCATSRAVVRARTSAIRSDVGRRGPRDSGADGPAERRAGDAGARAADLRANRECGDSGRVDCQARSEYVLGLRARNCTGRILDQQQIQAAWQEDVLSALGQIARRFRTRAGDSLAAVEKHAPLAETTTSSIEALKGYSAGRTAVHSGNNSAAVAFYRRAVELESRVRDGVRRAGTQVQLSWGIRAVGREHQKGVTQGQGRGVFNLPAIRRWPEHASHRRPPCLGELLPGGSRTDREGEPEVA